MSITLCYFTSRKRPEFHWWLNAVHQQCGGDYSGLKILLVDHWYEDGMRGVNGVERPLKLIQQRFSGKDIFGWCAPMPNVWNGPHRLPKQEWFAAATARNTALCVASTDWVAFCDDLSVPQSRWLKCVREGEQAGHVTFGSYLKVENMVWDGDRLMYYESPQSGIDSRWTSGNDEGPVPAGGSWLFGCSLVAPVEAFLRVNGFETDCDSMGFEDAITGMLLERTSGYQLRYDRRMLTLENGPFHHRENSMARRDKSVSPNDKSHAILNRILHGGQKMSINAHYGENGIRGLRAKIQAGEKFPQPTGPTHDWFDNEPIKDMILI